MPRANFASAASAQRDQSRDGIRTIRAMTSPNERGVLAQCVSYLFSAVTSAMQPARLPIALLAVFLIAGLAPLVDLAGGRNFGPRGFGAGALSDTEIELGYQRARSAANRIAGDDIDRLESEVRGEGGARRLSRSELAAAVRDATSRKIEERIANGTPSDDQEIERMRQRAAEAMLVIEETAPRGVATTFLGGVRVAVRQAVAGVLRLDFNAVLGAATAAIISLPLAAIRECPLVFPLALIVVLCAISLLAGGSCRMAAVHAGRSSRLGALEGAGYARARALHLVALPVLPTVFLALLALVVFAFAAILRIPILNVIAGALFVVPILVAMFGAILGVTAIAAFPLMPAAIAVEDCDAGDAITRAGALVLARPLVWLGMLLVATAVLVVGGLLVNVIVAAASLGIDSLLATVGGNAGRAISSGDASEIAALYGPDRLVGILVGFWNGLLDAVVVAYVFTLACDLATRGYLWMRERIDGENTATIAGYGIR